MYMVLSDLLFGLHMWVWGPRSLASVIWFVSWPYVRTQTLLLLSFLIPERVRVECFWFSSGSLSCKLENSHFPSSILGFWTITLLCRLSRAFGNTWTCASSEPWSFWKVELFLLLIVITLLGSELYVTLSWAVVRGCSWDARFIEILCYLYTDLGLEEPEDRNSSYFAWSNVMKRIWTMDLMLMLLDCATTFSSIVKVLASESPSSVCWEKVFTLLNLERGYKKHFSGEERDDVPFCFNARVWCSGGSWSCLRWWSDQ